MARSVFRAEGPGSLAEKSQASRVGQNCGEWSALYGHADGWQTT